VVELLLKVVGGGWNGTMETYKVIGGGVSHGKNVPLEIGMSWRTGSDTMEEAMYIALRGILKEDD